MVTKDRRDQRSRVVRTPKEKLRGEVTSCASGQSKGKVILRACGSQSSPVSDVTLPDCRKTPDVDQPGQGNYKATTRYTPIENAFLYEFTRKLQTRKGVILWDLVYNKWEEQAAKVDGGVSPRTISSLKCHQKWLAKQGIVRKRNVDADSEERTADPKKGTPVPTAGGYRSIEESDGESDSSVYRSSDEVDVDSEDGISGVSSGDESETKSAPDPIMEEFFREYHRSWKTDIRSSARRPKHLRPDQLELAEEFVRAAVEQKGTLRGVTTALYAVSKVYAGLDGSKPAGGKSAKEWFKENRSKLSLLRRESSWIVQELTRRRLRLKPTVRQRIIICKLRKRTQLKTNELRRRLIGLRERIMNINSAIRVRSNAISRRRLRTVVKPSRVLSEPTGVSKVAASECRSYWANIVGKRRPCRTNGRVFQQWSSDVGDKVRGIRDELDWNESWLAQTKITKSWTAAGPDGVKAFWWKTIPSARNFLNGWCKRVVDGCEEVPKWLCKGRVVLIPKGNNLSGPENQRPIACLNTALKLLNGMIARVLRARFEAVLPPEQRALRRGDWGVTHARLLDAAVIGDHISGKTNTLSMAWIDFSKAFDSIPHEYLKWCLNKIGAPKGAVKAYTTFLKRLKIQYEVTGVSGVERSRPLLVKCGVPQGDTLSPLMFCLAIAPISHCLRTEFRGYEKRCGTEVGNRTSHIYYVDDLKLYSSSPKELTAMIRKVRDTSRRINLELNAKKCATVHMMGGTIRAPKTPDDIPQLLSQETYKYLGIEQCGMDCRDEALRRAETQVVEKARRLFHSELDLNKKIKTYNGAIVPGVTFIVGNLLSGKGKSAGVAAWGKRLDLKVRSELNKAKVRFRTCSKDRVYLPQSSLGLGLRSIADAAEDALVYTYAYVACKDDLIPQYDLFTSMSERSKRSIVSDFKYIAKKYGFTAERELSGNGIPKVAFEGTLYEHPTKLARALTKYLKDKRVAKYLESWTKKPASSAVVRDDSVSMPYSSLWLQKGLVGAKTVRNIFALQESQLFSRGHISRCRGCRLCNAERETGQHIVSVCPQFRSTLMLERHNSVARNLLYWICTRYKLPFPHYTQDVPPEIESEEKNVVVWWDRYISTRNKLKHYRPDIVLYLKKQKAIYVIEVAVSWYTRANFMNKQKYAKYATNSCLDFDHPLPYPPGRSLALELERMYGATIKVLPIVIGCGGEVTDACIGNLRNLPGITETQVVGLLERLQRSCVIGTDRIIRAHLAAAEPDSEN